MFTALLTALIVGCLLYGSLSPLPLGALCIGSGGLLLFLGGHSHTGYLMIDVLAASSKLNRMNAALKSGAALMLIALCIAAPNPAVGLFLAAAMLALTVFVGGLPLHAYLHLMALPLTFLQLGGLTLLIEVSPAPTGLLHVPVLGMWLCVTAESQATAALVMSRALGAVSCLYLLSLSTPMPELIGVLQKLHCPNVVINLMYLIYRYLFILLAMVHTMKDAATSRGGYRNCRTALRTTGSVYAQLLARSYRRANQHFDAMESRCFEDDIRFLQDKRAIRASDVALFCGIGLAALVLALPV